MTGELCGLCSDCPTTGTWFRLFILDLLSVSAVGSTIPRPAVCCHWCASGRPVAAAAQHVRIIGGPLDTSWSSTFPLATAVSLSCPPTIFLATIWTAVGFLNSFLRAYPLGFDGRRSSLGFLWTYHEHVVDTVKSFHRSGSIGSGRL